jgi:hypothetical protein
MLSDGRSCHAADNLPNDKPGVAMCAGDDDLRRPMFPRTVEQAEVMAYDLVAG